MKVTAIIEKNETGLYSVYIQDNLLGCSLNGQGYSVDEAKAEMLEALEEILACMKDAGEAIPQDLLDLDIEYKYDLASLFNYFKEINVSALARKAGMNESLLRKYRNGLAFASDVQKQKIIAAINDIGQELADARF